MENAILAECTPLLLECTIAMMLFCAGSVAGKLGMALLMDCGAHIPLNTKLTVYMRTFALIGLAVSGALGHFMGGPLWLALGTFCFFGTIFGIALTFARLFAVSVNLGAKDTITLMALMDHMKLTPGEVTDIVKKFTDKTDQIQTK